MRFSIDTASLKRAIGIVARTAFNKGVEQSILECIHIKADEDEVVFRTYNSVTATRCSVNADVSSPGEAALPARVLSDVVNKLFADTTTFDTEESSFTTVVSSGKARLSLQGPDPEGFPSPDFNSDGAETILIEDQTQLRTLIDGTSFAASQDEDKPVYTGLLLQGEGDRLSMIGIDGVRIAKRSIMMEASSDIYEIIPSRTLKDISRLLDDPEKSVTLRRSGNMLEFDIGDTVVYTRLLDGTFLDYRALMPANYTTRLRVSRKELEKSIEMVSVIASKDNLNLVMINILDGEVNLSSKSTYGSIDDSIPAALEGEPMRIAFNSRYVHDAIRAIPDEELFIETVSKNSPCLLRPVGDGNWLHFIVPVNVRE